MIIVETIAKIRRMYHVQGKGFKTIARELNLSKNTVKKTIRSDITQKNYLRAVQPYRILGEFRGLLETKLEYDRDEPKRRKRTSKKLYNEIISEGYKGSYEAVNNFVNAWKLDREGLNPATFVPLDFPAGDAFQFDWSEEEIELDGVLTRIKVAHIRLCHSRFFLTIAYPNEQLEMVMDAHDKAFEFFGGVCQKGIYDNMKTAVTFVFLGKERKFNKRFMEMVSHHLFEPVACTPRSGWEKGQVENQVCTSRRNFFTPLVRVKTLDELNKKLMQDCLDWAKTTNHPELKEKTTWEVYLQEKTSLLSYRSGFEAFKLIPTTVSSTCLVNIDTNAYSVDCHYVRKNVELRIYADKVKVYYKSTLIGEHERSFGRHQKIYNPWHYVPILERKPGALRHGAPFKDWELPSGLLKVKEALLRYSDGDKQFIKILLEINSFGLAAVDAICNKFISEGISQADIIINALNDRNKIDESSKETPDKILLEQTINFDNAIYNDLYTERFSELTGDCHAA